MYKLGLIVTEMTSLPYFYKTDPQAQQRGNLLFSLTSSMTQQGYQYFLPKGGLF